MIVTVHDKNGTKIAEAYPSNDKELEDVKNSFAVLKGACRMYVDHKPVKFPKIKGQ